ncbi:MAG: GIY-YIG nuclease family protein [Bacteroidota bacterium]
MSTPKTIQIFLPDGNPRSVRIAEITSRTVRAVEVPRSKLAVAASRSEVRQVGLYFLFGEDEDAARPRVYIGESEDCLNRLGDHHKKKDFWTRGVAVTSKTRHFDKAKVKWLEWHALAEAERVGRYEVENTAFPAEPHISEPVRADLLDTFGTVRTLLATLGFPVFEAFHVPAPEASTVTYTCSGRGVTARGEYVEDGMLVLAGSEAALRAVASWRGTAAENKRQRLVEGGVLVCDGDRYLFAKDYLLGTPSTAAKTVLGRNSNGWTSWKDAEGRTLDERERQPLG